LSWPSLETEFPLPGGLGASERRRFAPVGSFGFRQGPYEEMPHQSGRLHPNGPPIGLLSGTTTHFRWSGLELNFLMKNKLFFLLFGAILGRQQVQFDLRGEYDSFVPRRPHGNCPSVYDRVEPVGQGDDG
jgi:hypothetical protein